MLNYSLIKMLNYSLIIHNMTTANRYLMYIGHKILVNALSAM